MKNSFPFIRLSISLQTPRFDYRTLFCGSGWKLLLLTAFSWAFMPLLPAQTPPTLQWEASYGSVSNDGPRNILATSDGGYLVVGQVTANTGDVAGSGYVGSNDGWVIKLNASGAIVWKKAYGSTGYDQGIQQAIEVSDGYVLVGSQYYSGGISTDKVWYAKVSKTSGAITWSQFYNSTFQSLGYTITATPDGGYLVGGYLYDNGGKALLLKTNSTGVVTSTYTSNPSGGLWGESITQIEKTADGGYLLLGTYYDTSEPGCNPQSEVPDPYDVWLCKLSSTYTSPWSKTYGGTTTDYPQDMVVVPSGDIFVLGRTNCTGTVTGPNNVGVGDWVLKTNSTGVLQTVQVVSLNILDNTRKIYGIGLSCDNQLLICGQTGGLLGTSAVVIKMTTALANIWTFSTTASTTIARAASDVTGTSDNGYVVVGSHTSTAKGSDFYIAKLTADPGCGGSGGSFCDKATTVSCGQYLANQSTIGETNSISSYPCITNSTFTGNDRVYKIVLTQTSDLQVGLEILTSGADLDLFLLSNNCTTVTCLDYSGTPNSATNKEGILKSLTAGTYYIVVDSYDPAIVGNFNIDFACSELNCSNPTVLTCGIPYSSTTVGYSNNVSIYKQTATMVDEVPDKKIDVNNAGPERLHQFTIAQQSTVTITLSGVVNTVNLEMFLLNACNKNNCIAKSTTPAGPNEVITQQLNAGTYYVVVEGFRNNAGAYTLTVDCGGCPAPVNNFNCNLVKCYYSGNGSNLQYTFTGSQAIAPGYNWKITGNNQTITGNTSTTYTYNFPAAGNYQVCFPYLLATGCVEYCCINLCVANPFDCDNSISPTFDAAANGWYFKLSGSGYTNIQWRNDATGSSAGTGYQSTLIPVPNPCNSAVAQSVSVAYFDGSCYRVCCFRYYPCNPFNCGLITYSYDAAQSGYRFRLNTIGGFDPATIIWTADYPVTLALGTGSDQSNLLPLPATCAEYGISVRFRDGTGSWVICCIKIYVCNPFTCLDFAYNYVPASSGFQFILNLSGTTNVSWTVDDAPGGPLNIGNTTTSNVYPVPGTCVERTITVRYFWNGRWYICCRKVYLCNPFDCFDFAYNYVSASNGYQFLLNQSGTSSISWTVDDAPGGAQNIGNASTSNVYPVPGTCVQRTITVRYFWNNRWYICCRKVYLCNPAQCTGEINTTWVNGGQITLSVNTAYQNVQWKSSTGILLGSANSITVPNPGSNTEVCVFYRDAGNIWRICCKNIGTPPNPASDLTFDIDDNVCGGNNTVVQIPIRVRNFTNVTTFEMSIGVANGLLAQLEAIQIGGLPGTSQFEVLNTTTGELLWYNATPVTVADNTVIGTLNIRLTGTAGNTALNITDNPLAISAEQSIGGVTTQVTPTVVSGSACIAANFSISGHILRQDSVGVGNVTVKLTGSSTQTATTDNLGNYAFSALTAGGNYIITPEKDISDKNGVNGGDLVVIQRHILGLSPLTSPYKRIAADANNSKSINGGDLVSIQRLILGLDLTLPANTSWQFVDKKHVFANPNTPWTPQYPVALTYNNLAAGVTDADFVGVKIADVNLSNNPVNLVDATVEDRRMAGFKLETEDLPINRSTKTILLPIRAAAAYELESFQFTLQFDPAVLRFKSITGSENIPGFGDENFNANLADSGYLSLVWAVPDGKSTRLRQDDLLLWVELEVIQNPTVDITLQDMLRLNGSVAAAVATTRGGQENGISLQFKKSTPGALHYFIAPNPFSGKAYLHLFLPEEQTVEVSLFSIAGKALSSQQSVLPVGHHTLPIECVSCDETQLLLYKIQTGSGRSTGKLLFLKNQDH